MASTMKLYVLVVLLLPSIVFAGPLTSCSLQSDCISFTVEESTSKTCGSTSCLWKVCLKFDTSLQGCQKDGSGTISHVCDSGNDFTGCARNWWENAGGWDSNEIEDFADSASMCVYVPKGEDAKFLLKDGWGCEGFESFGIAQGAAAKCVPSTQSTCTGNRPGRECWWTVTTPPGSCAAPPPTPRPTAFPTKRPTAFPTLPPTPKPTPSPTPPVPSSNPSRNPTPNPTSSPTSEPTPVPTSGPTSAPTPGPTSGPTSGPTESLRPSMVPSDVPSAVPSISSQPSLSTMPSVLPSSEPTQAPTVSAQPSRSPSESPSAAPSISSQPSLSSMPSLSPTFAPTNDPTSEPTRNPTSGPTSNPTFVPTPDPTNFPTPNPTSKPTIAPTKNPTKDPTLAPTPDPTNFPTPNPTSKPTIAPTKNPTKDPTLAPTLDPTNFPTPNPTSKPTIAPTKTPTKTPTKDPSAEPTLGPTIVPPPAAGGGTLSSCSLQRDCIGFTVEEAPSDTCGSCQWKVCLQLDNSLPGCRKDGYISHACDSGEDVTGCLRDANDNGGWDSVETVPFNNLETMCVVVPKGEEAKFLLKDGGKCEGFEFFGVEDSFAFATCTPSEERTCTGNRPGVECWWRVSTPAGDCVR